MIEKIQGFIGVVVSLWVLIIVGIVGEISVDVYSAHQQAELYRRLYGINVSTSEVFFGGDAIKEVGIKMRGKKLSDEWSTKNPQGPQ